MKKRRYPAATAEAGFTLVEALVAMALMAMVLGALASISSAWIPNWNHGIARLQRNESVALGNLRCDVGLDRLIDVRENVQRHQLRDELVRFEAKLRRQFLDDDWRLDVNDFLFRLGLDRRLFRNGFGRSRGWRRGRRDWREDRAGRLETGDRRKNRGAFYRSVGFSPLRLWFFLVNERDALDVAMGRRL